VKRHIAVDTFALVTTHNTGYRSDTHSVLGLGSRTTNDVFAEVQRNPTRIKPQLRKPD